MRDSPSKSNGLHAFRRGARVAVYGRTSGGRPFIEGWAVIAAPIPGVIDLYWMIFEGERCERVRAVHPGEWQDAPERMIDRLQVAWLLSAMPELTNEFFPDGIGQKGGLDEGR